LALALFRKHRKLGCFGSFRGWTLLGCLAVAVFIREFDVVVKKHAKTVYSLLALLRY
jgi:uncharacterized transporter YbjL